MNSTQNQTTMEYRVIVCDYDDEDRYIAEQSLFSWEIYKQEYIFNSEDYNNLCNKYNDQILINSAKNKKHCKLLIFNRDTSISLYQEIAENEKEIYDTLKKLKNSCKLKWVIPEERKEYKLFLRQVKKEYTSPIEKFSPIVYLILVGSALIDSLLFVELGLFSFICLIIDSIRKENHIRELIRIYKLCEYVSKINPDALHLRRRHWTTMF